MKRCKALSVDGGFKPNEKAASTKCLLSQMAAAACAIPPPAHGAGGFPAAPQPRIFLKIEFFWTEMLAIKKTSNKKANSWLADLSSAHNQYNKKPKTVAEMRVIWRPKGAVKRAIWLPEKLQHFNMPEFLTDMFSAKISD